MWYKCGHWSRVVPPCKVIPPPYYFLPSFHLFYLFYPFLMVSFPLWIAYTKFNTIQIQNPFYNGNASYGMRFDCLAVHQAGLLNMVTACLSACEGAAHISTWPAGRTVLWLLPRAEVALAFAWRTLWKYSSYRAPISTSTGLPCGPRDSMYHGAVQWTNPAHEHHQF